MGSGAHGAKRYVTDLRITHIGGAIDAVLLTHDHHDDKLDPAGRALLPSAGVVAMLRDDE